MIIVIIAIGFVASAVISVMTLHLGAEIGTAILGKDRCLSTNSVNGCNWWPLSIIISTVCVGLAASQYGFLALALVPVGPVLSILLLTLRLRFGEGGSRDRQFKIIDGRIFDRNDREIRPVFLRDSSEYYATGPASGYCLYRLILHEDDGTIHTNGYVSEEKKNLDLEGLRKLGVPWVSIVFAWQVSDKELHSVTLGQEWAPFLCGRLESLPEAGRIWWKKWLQPHFGRLGSGTVSREELSGRLNEFQMALRDSIQKEERIRTDCLAIRHLISQAEGSVSIMTEAASARLLEDMRGDKMIAGSVENLVWVSKVVDPLDFKP